MKLQENKIIFATEKELNNCINYLESFNFQNSNSSIDKLIQQKFNFDMLNYHIAEDKITKLKSQIKILDKEKHKILNSAIIHSKAKVKKAGKEAQAQAEIISQQIIQLRKEIYPLETYQNKITHFLKIAGIDYKFCLKEQYNSTFNDLKNALLLFYDLNYYTACNEELNQYELIFIDIYNNNPTVKKILYKIAVIFDLLYKEVA